MVEKANVTRLSVTICLPIEGIPQLKAREVRDELFSPLVHASGKISITKAVIEQMMIVSKNIPDMETSPWLKGLSVCAAAWAIGVLPNPASLEKTPLMIPIKTLIKRLKS